MLEEVTVTCRQCQRTVTKRVVPGVHHQYCSRGCANKAHGDARMGHKIKAPDATVIGEMFLLLGFGKRDASDYFAWLRGQNSGACQLYR